MQDNQGKDTGQATVNTILSRRSTMAAIGGVMGTSLFGLPAVAQEGAGEPLWDLDIGAGPTSPTVAYGNIYVGTREGADTALYAVDQATGEVEWSVESPHSRLTTATVVDGVVFVGSGGLFEEETGFLAYDAATGDEIWRYMQASDELRPPTVADGMMYGASRVGTLYALDAETGAEEWTYGGVSSPPTVLDGTLYAASSSTLRAIEAESGEEEWTYSLATADTKGVAVSDGTAYVGDEEGLHAVDAQTGDQEWIFDGTEGVIGSGTTIMDDLVYFGTDESTFHAVNIETGEQEWSYEGIRPEVESLATVADGLVFFGGTDDYLYAHDAQTGEQEWRYRFGNWVQTSPIVVDGVVYATSRSEVAAIDAGVDGSSEDVITELGTVNHHEDWIGADQSLDIGTVPESDDDDDSTDDDSLGLSIGGTLAGVGGAAYLLKRGLGGEKTELE